MKNIFTIIYIVTIFISCNNKFDGKIDQRHNAIYLVNTSPTHGYQFTVKKTEIKDSSAYSYSTELISLSPGDEKYLGEQYFEKRESYGIVLDTSDYSKSIEIFTPTSKQISKKRKALTNGTADELLAEALYNSANNQFDTIINGRLMMYRKIYKTHPLVDSVHKFQAIFEITGQVKIN